MIFELTPEQVQESKDFMKNHKCRSKKKGIIRHASYRFTYTGIGVSEVIECSCGKSLDLTDYGKW